VLTLALTELLTNESDVAETSPAAWTS